MKNNSLRHYIFAAAVISLPICSCGVDGGGYDASGTFEATELTVSSEADGKILSLEVGEGDSVSRGQVCGQIDTVRLCLNKRQLEARIRAAESRIQDIESQTAYMKEQLSAYTREKGRIENLIRADAANTKQLDDINTSIAVLQSQINATEASISSGNEAARAEIASLQAQIAMIDDQISRCRIVSPISGTVMATYLQQGELAGTGRPVLKIADLENMYIRAYITAGQLSSARLGQKVRIYADGSGKAGKVYEGVLTWISDQAEFTPKTIQTKDERSNLVYAIKVSFKNDGYARIGMYGDIKFL